MKTPRIKNLLPSLLLGGCLAIAASVQAVDIVKTNNTDNLNLTTSWVGGVAPGAADVAVWDSIVTGPNTTLLGASLNWNGMRIANPGGLVTIDAGNTLTLGAAGIDMSSATQDLTLNCGVTIGAGAVQKWNVAGGRSLTLAAIPNKPGQPSANTGVLEVGTTGSVRMGATGLTVSCIRDNQGNPWATYGPNDWATLDDFGYVIAGSYADVTTSLVANTNNNIVGDLGGGSGSAVDVHSIRFNDPTFRTLNIANSGTARTMTARGVLVTANCGGGLIGGTANTSFIRPARSTIANTAFNIIQNSPANFTIAAIISNGSSSAPTRVVKSGPGNLIISGGLNGYSGGTDVNGGTLTVASGGTLGSGGVTVVGGAFVGTSGATIAPGVTFNSGTTNRIVVQAANGQFAQGAATYSGTAELVILTSSGVTLSTTVAPFKVNGLLTVNGTVNLSVLSGGITTGTFPLIEATNGLAGAGSIVLTTLPPRVNATLNTNGNIIELVVSSVNQPVTWTKGSETWNFSSTNWQDAVATPAVYKEIGGLGDSVVFQDSLSGGSPITVTLNTTVAPASVTVSNVSKTYTISGSGNIGGVGGLSKQGSGSLTLATANTFSGGVSLNGGTTVFSALNNLGTGSLTIGGGTLQYNGNSDDLSVRTVTFGAGGAGLNVGAGFVTFANPVGNGGVGGLTKSGTGTLTLSGANNYSGATVVSQGTLALASGATLPNSSSLSVSSGAILDASASGLTLNGAVSQVLAGSGSVNGNVTVGTGTSLTPGTSPGTLTVNNDLTLSGGTYVFDVSTNAGKDLIVVGGNLSLSNGTVQVVAAGNLTNGLYRLINYSGSLSGAAGNLVLSGFSQAGKIATLDDSIGGQINLKVETAGGASLTWRGFGSDWDVGTSVNWLNAATPATYINGDFVTFNDAGSAVPTANLVGTLAPGGIVVSNVAVDYTLSTSGSGLISGSAGITKSGTGKLTILTPNNNSGRTLVNAGTLQVGDGFTTGDLGTGPVTNNAALVFQQTDVRSVASIAGTGSLNQSGTSTLTVNGAANYTGPTTIGAGATLQIGNGGAAGALSTSAITNEGTLILNSSNNWTLSMSDTGNGVLRKQGAGTVTLSGANTRTGETRVDGGKVILGSANHLKGSARVEAGGTLDINGNDQLVTGLSSTLFSGGLVVNNAGTATNAIIVANAGTSDSSIVLQNNEGTGGILKLVKTDVGELILRGASSHSGGTVISNGTLNLSSGTGLGTGLLTLHDGTTLNDRTSFFGNPVHTAAGATVTFLSSALGNSTSGDLTSGDANSTNLINNGMSFSAGSVKQFQGFTGTVQVGLAGIMRFSASTLSINGGDTTTFALEGPIQTRNGTGTAAGNGIYLGAVMDVPGSFFPGSLKGGDSSPFGTTTYIVGGKGLSTSFSGSIEGTAPSITSIVKTGAGSWTLSGLLSYEGSTTVNGGSLILTTSADLDDSPSITVSGGTLDVTGIGGLPLGNLKNQTLAGAGTVTGSVTASGTFPATITPGSPVGTLTVSGALTQAANSAIVMDLNRTNSPATNDMITAASIAADGTLTVTNLGPDLVTGDKFKLFSVPVSGFSAISLPVSNALNTIAYGWTNKLAIDGTIELLSGASAINPNPTNITFSAVGGNLNLSWPPSHLGWILQAQSNTRSVGLSNNWADIAGSASITATNFPLEATNGAVFYRLRKP